MYIKNSRFLVVGISKSGYSACNVIMDEGGKCYIYDDSKAQKTIELMNDLTLKGAEIVNIENIEETIEKSDIVLLSPGVAIDNMIPITARKLHKKVMGELELGSLIIKNPIVAITGTNGKTTTCSLVEHTLKCADIKNFVAGNIGIPLCDKIHEDKDSIAILEVSSFQLETVSSFTPHIACILNITPDHLSRHYNMENYIYLKGRILKNMRESEYAVLNYDDNIVREFSGNTRANIVYFSMIQKVDGGYVEDNKIYYKDEFIMNTSDLALKGGHNIQNSLAVLCICKLLGVSNQQIVEGLSSFNGVRHRQQFIKEINGVTYINDSKSTNPESSVQAVNNCGENTILLLGGRDKGDGYEKLFSVISNNKNIKEVVIFGQSRNKLFNLACKADIENVSLFRNFENAVNYCFYKCESGDKVLLSPGCSSFDEFSSFEERGEFFISMVENHSLKYEK